MRDLGIDVVVTRLAPAAVLLTDTPDDAVRLLAAALSRPGALHSPDAARQALSSALVHPPRWAAEQVIGSLDPPAPDDDGALAEALHSLPPARRAAVVLARDAAATAALRAVLDRHDAEHRRAHARETAAF